MEIQEPKDREKQTVTARERILSRIRLGQPRVSTNKSYPPREDKGSPDGPPQQQKLGDEVPAPSEESLLETFRTECEHLAVKVHIARNADRAGEKLASILDERKIQEVIQWDPGDLPQIGMEEIFRTRGIEPADSGGTLSEESSFPDENPWRKKARNAEAGITSAAWALADSGTLVLDSGPGRPRSASLLPPLHIALIRSRDILPDLRALIARLRKQTADGFPPDRCLTLITGPSKTSDIEMKPVQGVHGPGEIHVIILTGTSDAEKEENP